jgi:hypothetical protein
MACTAVDLPGLVRPIGEPVTLSPAELPSYREGIWLLFDDGRLERVAEASGDTVTWTRGKHTSEVRYRNTALPRLSWDQETTRGDATLTAPVDALWPLRQDGSARFVEHRTVVDKDDGSSRRYRRHWSCEVAQPVRLSTQAGQFDTFPITCTRVSTTRAMRTLETHRWFYAPSVGHYVRHEHGRRDRERVVRTLILRGDRSGPLLSLDPELAAVLSDALGQAARPDTPIRVIASSGRSIQVAMGPSWQLDTGRLCREYRAEVDRIDISGAACRYSDGRWQPLGADRPGFSS